MNESYKKPQIQIYSYKDMIIFSHITKHYNVNKSLISCTFVIKPLWTLNKVLNQVTLIWLFYLIFVCCLVRGSIIMFLPFF